MHSICVRLWADTRLLILRNGAAGPEVPVSLAVVGGITGWRWSSDCHQPSLLPEMSPVLGAQSSKVCLDEKTQEVPRMASSDPPRAPKGLGAGAGMASRSHRLCSVLWYDVSWLFSGFVQQIMLSSASAEEAFVLLSLSPVLGSLFTLEAYKNVRFLTLWCQNRGYSKQIEKPSKMLGFFNVTPKQICAGQSLCS